MSDNRDCISIADGFTAAKKSRGTCGWKIDSNQEPRDRRDKRPSDSDTRTTGGFADGDEFQAITTAEYFNDGTRLRGGRPKGRPPRERTTPASIIYYVTLGGEGGSLPHWWRDPPTVSFSTLVARMHHRTLFIRQNLNYTFDRTSQRPPPSCCRSKRRDVAMLNALRRAFKTP